MTATDCRQQKWGNVGIAALFLARALESQHAILEIECCTCGILDVCGQTVSCCAMCHYQLRQRGRSVGLELLT